MTATNHTSDVHMNRYHGRRGGGYVQGAAVCEMKAGNFEIVCDDLPGCVLQLTEYTDSLIIQDSQEYIAVLPLSDTAVKKMNILMVTVEEMYQSEYGV